MITSNVIQRVFKIKNNGSVGTIFTIEIDNKQYIITAKHLATNIYDSAQVMIYHENQWKTIDFKLIGHCPDPIDISVFATDIQLTPSNLPSEPTCDGIVYGQDVYFLGFPYDLSGMGESINRGFPMPFVKKAILSAIINENNITLLCLDGHNNPGFSGGPVVFQKSNKKEFNICSVISGFHAQQEPIYDSGSPLSMYVHENTGIILSYSINSAIEIIQNNPLGFIINNQTN